MSPTVSAPSSHVVLLSLCLCVEQEDQTSQVFSAIAQVVGVSERPSLLRERYSTLTSGEGSSQAIPNLDE